MMPPLAPTKPNFPGLSRISIDGLGDAVQRVAVAGPAEVRQPAGQRQPARVVGGEPELVAHRRTPGTGSSCRGRRWRRRRRRCLPPAAPPATASFRAGADTEVRAVQQGLFDQVGVPVQVHPLLLGHTEPAGCAHRHQHRGRALVDGVAGDHQPRVRVADHPVLVGDRLDLLRPSAPPGTTRTGSWQRLSRTARTARPSFAGTPRRRGPARPSRVVEQAVLHRRAGQPVRRGVLVM